MLGGHTPLTIWNRRSDDSGFERYNINLLCRHTTRAINQSFGHGASMSASIVNTQVLRIPYTGAYKTPKEWNELESMTRQAYYTAQVDDYVAIGEHDYDITEDFTLAHLREALGHILFQIKSVRDSSRAALGKHIRIEGV